MLGLVGCSRTLAVELVVAGLQAWVAGTAVAIGLVDLLQTLAVVVVAVAVAVGGPYFVCACLCAFGVDEEEE